MNTGKPSILVVEDEPQLTALLRDYLEQSDFHVDCIADGNEVVAKVKSSPPALILLDIMLPGKDGMAICREIRAFSDVPVIMVTARVEEIDRLLGLELGADDYMCKPFSPREVVARVKAVLRRSERGRVSKPSGNIRFDDDRYKAILQGQELDLTVIEFQLLKILASDEGRIFSREQLMDRIYHDHRIVSDRTIDSHIKKLRKKIAEIQPDMELIHSVYGAGYKYEQDN